MDELRSLRDGGQNDPQCHSSLPAQGWGFSIGDDQPPYHISTPAERTGIQRWIGSTNSPSSYPARHHQGILIGCSPPLGKMLTLCGFLTAGQGCLDQVSASRLTGTFRISVMDVCRDI